MASAEGGYECDFCSEVPEDLICSVCHFVVKEPIQLENCGHGMCKLCFNQLKDHADSKYKSNIYFNLCLSIHSDNWNLFLWLTFSSKVLGVIYMFNLVGKKSCNFKFGSMK